MDVNPVNATTGFVDGLGATWDLSACDEPVEESSIIMSESSANSTMAN